jgi:hypothetical protein
MEDKN